MGIRAWVLVLLLIAIAGAWLGAMMQMDPGYVLFAWRNTSVEMSLWMWLALTALAYVGLHISVRLLLSLNAPMRLMSRWSENSQLRRMQMQTRQGLLALANGQYKRAADKLSNLPAGTQPLVVVPALAQAEARLGQSDKALQHLDQLAVELPDAKALVWMAKARILFEKGDAEGALVPLQSVIAMDKGHSQANEMLLELLQGLQQWRAVIDQLQVIEANKLMPATVLEQQQQKAYSQAFSHQTPGEQALDALQQLWRKAPAAVKKDKSTKIALVKAMHLAEGDPAKRTAEFIESSLKIQWDDNLVLEYAHLPLTDLEHALSKAEAWQTQAQDSAALQLTLGRLCRRLELWGKASDYLQCSIDLQANKEAHAEMARLQQQLGNLDSALEHYRCASIF